MITFTPSPGRPHSASAVCWLICFESFRSVPSRSMATSRIGGAAESSEGCADASVIAASLYIRWHVKNENRKEKFRNRSIRRHGGGGAVENQGPRSRARPPHRRDAAAGAGWKDRRCRDRAGG